MIKVTPQIHILVVEDDKDKIETVHDIKTCRECLSQMHLVHRINNKEHRKEAYYSIIRNCDCIPSEQVQAFLALNNMNKEDYPINEKFNDVLRRRIPLDEQSIFKGIKNSKRLYRTV